MDATEILREITIPTPCPMDWNRMRGDDRVRHCTACGKHVYNFTAMTSEEAVSLIRAQGGKLCAQIYRRPDGTLVSSDCPPEPQPTPGHWQFNIRSLMAVIAGFAALFGITKLFSSVEPPITIPAPPPTATPLFRGGDVRISPRVMQVINNPSGAQPK
jgi:hypothetical protein